MSEWITDRLPTEDDADDVGCVWHDCKGKVYRLYFASVEKGEPWHPIAWPEPYPRSVRWAVKWYEDYAIWCLLDTDVVVLVLDKNLTTAAAQRIADVYNEVMP